MKRRSALCFAAIALALLTACVSPQNPQELKEKTARATAEAKRDARAIAQGVREGWSRDKPLDLNSATKDQLTQLPGITDADADRIVANRPYRNPEELESRRILSKSKYDRIADLVKAK